ncbi:hypothetical protein PV326_005400, partial [Microctonus aethiopoides]
APIRENNLNSSIMAPLINTPTRQILTPERTLTQTPGLDTPIINERLSLSQNSTINSPGHISTPDSPYGQVFKPNPSPATRKMWVEMMYPEHIANKILPNRTWFQIVNPHYRGEYRQDRPTMDDHDELSVNKDDEMETPINRVLAFTEDEESRSKKNALDEQLEQRDKILRATSTSKTPCSLLRKKEKAYEEPRDHIMPATQPESVCWEDLKRIAKDAQEKLPLDIVEEISTKIDPSRRRKFMLSGLRKRFYIYFKNLFSNDRCNYEEIIKHLGGEVSPDTTFNMHCSYLRDCERAGEFINEGKWWLWLLQKYE